MQIVQGKSHVNPSEKTGIEPLLPMSYWVKGYIHYLVFVISKKKPQKNPKPWTGGQVGLQNKQKGRDGPEVILRYL